MAAASLPATVTNVKEIKMRNDNLNRQLAANNLRSIDVRGDGNCYFRSLSVVLYGDESHHAALRESISEELLNISRLAPAADMQDIHAHVENIKKDGVYVGEDVIVASASCLGRNICVYIASIKSSPLVYKPPYEAKLSQVCLAFYEPDHYRAVIPYKQSETITTSHVLSGTLTSSKPSVNINTLKATVTVRAQACSI